MNAKNKKVVSLILGFMLVFVVMAPAIARATSPNVLEGLQTQLNSIKLQIISLFQRFGIASDKTPSCAYGTTDGQCAVRSGSMTSACAKEGEQTNDTIKCCDGLVVNRSVCAKPQTKCQNAGQFCGGIAAGAFQCCAGLVCKLNGNYPDAGGTCVANQPCPDARGAKAGEACNLATTFAKNPQSGQCCQYPSSCNAPEDWSTFKSERECENLVCLKVAEPPASFCRDGTATPISDNTGCVSGYECKKIGTCPAPLESGNLCLPPVKAFAKNPDTGECCSYESTCVIPKDWRVFYSKEECASGTLNCVGEGGAIGYEVTALGSNDWERTGKYLKCCDGLVQIDYATRPNTNGVCTSVHGWLGSTCTRCGDGICGSGENKCNCPHDCK